MNCRDNQHISLYLIETSEGDGSNSMQFDLSAKLVSSLCVCVCVYLCECVRARARASYYRVKYVYICIHTVKKGTRLDFVLKTIIHYILLHLSYSLSNWIDSGINLTI